MAGNLFYFNPTCEMAIANGTASYTPPMHLEVFRKDLSLMPIYFGDSRDVVVIENIVPTKFLERFKERGWDLPFVVNSPTDIPSLEFTLDSFTPWGWSPSVRKNVEAYLPFINQPYKNHHFDEWKPEYKNLMSRLTGQKLSQMIYDSLDNHRYISIPTPPIRVEDISQLVEIEENMESQMLLKTPWSASGRGLFKIRSRQEGVAQNNWIKSKFKHQGFLMAEPFLNKVQDLSFHFKKELDNFEFLGITFFASQDDGQFLGSFIGTPNLNFESHFPLEEVLEESKDILLSSLKKIDSISLYNGYIGVDAMLFLDKHMGVKLHPCIEVNLRHTMGLLNLFLRKKVHPASFGFWKIISLQSEDALTLLEKQNKIVWENGLLVSGEVALTPPHVEGGFAAVLSLDS